MRQYEEKIDLYPGLTKYISVYDEVSYSLKTQKGVSWRTGFKVAVKVSRYKFIGRSGDCFPRDLTYTRASGSDVWECQS